jgi:hypothetical protein
VPSPGAPGAPEFALKALKNKDFCAVFRAAAAFLRGAILPQADRAGNKAVSR